MPQITCHECGRKRLVVAGKRKNCRGCGTRLTDQQQPLTKLHAKKKAAKLQDISLADLAKMYPNQVAEIVTAAKADVVAEKFEDLELKPDEVEAAFPDQVAELVLKATAETAEIAKDAAKKLKDAVAAAKKEGQASILKLSAGKIAKLQAKQKKPSDKG